MQTGSVILKTWAVKHSGLTFMAHPVQRNTNNRYPMQSELEVGPFIETQPNPQFLDLTLNPNQPTFLSDPTHPQFSAIKKLFNNRQYKSDHLHVSCW